MTSASKTNPPTLAEQLTPFISNLSSGDLTRTEQQQMALRLSRLAVEVRQLERFADEMVRNEQEDAEAAERAATQGKVVWLHRNGSTP